MTLAELSAGEIFVSGTHIIQKQTGISRLESFPRADQVARRLSPDSPPVDKHFSSLLRQYELVGSVKASIHLEDRTDQTIHDAAIEALEILDALEASAPCRLRHRRAWRSAPQDQARASSRLHPNLRLLLPRRSSIACHDERARPGDPGRPSALRPPHLKRFAVGSDCRGGAASTWPDPCLVNCAARDRSRRNRKTS